VVAPRGTNLGKEEFEGGCSMGFERERAREREGLGRERVA